MFTSETPGCILAGVSCKPPAVPSQPPAASPPPSPDQILIFSKSEFTVGGFNLKTPVHLQNLLASNRRVLLPLLTPVTAA